MIVRETKSINEKVFNCTYSDENKYIVRDDVKYEKAYDLAELGYEYVESEECIKEVGAE